MSTPAKQKRIEVINKICETQYNLINLHDRIDDLLERSITKCSDEDDEFLNESFGQIASGIMRVWFMYDELDKMMAKEQEQKS